MWLRPPPMFDQFSIENNPRGFHNSQPPYCSYLNNERNFQISPIKDTWNENNPQSLTWKSNSEDNKYEESVKSLRKSQTAKSSDCEKLNKKHEEASKSMKESSEVGQKLDSNISVEESNKRKFKKRETNIKKVQDVSEAEQDVEIPVEALFCHICTISTFSTKEDYLKHKKSEGHQEKKECFQLRDDAQLQYLRINAAYNVFNNAPKVANISTKCNVCCIVVMDKFKAHRHTAEHLALVRFTNPECCSEKFSSRNDFFEHLLSLKHLKNVFQLEEKEREENFEVKKAYNLGAAKHYLNAKYQRSLCVSLDCFELTTGIFCKICGVNVDTNKEELQEHVSSIEHWRCYFFSMKKKEETLQNIRNNFEDFMKRVDDEPRKRFKGESFLVSLDGEMVPKNHAYQSGDATWKQNQAKNRDNLFHILVNFKTSRNFKSLEFYIENRKNFSDLQNYFCNNMNFDQNKQKETINDLLAQCLDSDSEDESVAMPIISNEVAQTVSNEVAQAIIESNSTSFSKSTTSWATENAQKEVAEATCPSNSISTSERTSYWATESTQKDKVELAKNSVSENISDSKRSHKDENVHCKKKLSNLRTRMKVKPAHAMLMQRFAENSADFRLCVKNGELDSERVDSRYAILDKSLTRFPRNAVYNFRGPVIEITHGYGKSSETESPKPGVILNENANFLQESKTDKNSFSDNEQRNDFLHQSNFSAGKPGSLALKPEASHCSSATVNTPENRFSKKDSLETGNTSDSEVSDVEDSEDDLVLENKLSEVKSKFELRNKEGHPDKELGCGANVGSSSFRPFVSEPEQLVMALTKNKTSDTTLYEDKAIVTENAALKNVEGSVGNRLEKLRFKNEYFGTKLDLEKLLKKLEDSKVDPWYTSTCSEELRTKSISDVLKSELERFENQCRSVKAKCHRKADKIKDNLPWMTDDIKFVIAKKKVAFDRQKNLHRQRTSFGKSGICELQSLIAHAIFQEARDETKSKVRRAKVLAADPVIHAVDQ